MKRREARELAFVHLFEQTFTDDPIDGIIAISEAHRDVKFDDFARGLCELTYMHRDTIDAHINRHATRWGVNRLPRVTLTLMRMCIAEIDYMEDVPVSVSINEAVELCKTYAGEEDAAFLNGVLGAYVKGEDAKIDLPERRAPAVAAEDIVTLGGDEIEK